MQTRQTRRLAPPPLTLPPPPQDYNTQNAWLGHPNHYCFDNRGDFEDKLQRMISIVGKIVGLPGFERSTTKFLLKATPAAEDIRAAGLECQVFEIEKVYLYAEESGGRPGSPGSPGGVSTPPSPSDRKVLGGASPVPGRLRAATRSPSFDGKEGSIESEAVSEYSFIRKRTSNGSSSYGVTTVQTHKNGTKIEIKRIITGREYSAGLKTRDLSRHIVRQERLSFIYKQQSFNIHVYKKPIAGVSILHLQGVAGGEKKVEAVGGRKRRGSFVKGKKEGQEFELPEFLEVERLLDLKSEADSKYGAYKISRKAE